jgi:hypothetical protein
VEELTKQTSEGKGELDDKATENESLKEELEQAKVCFRLFQTCCFYEGIIVLCRVVLFNYVKAECDRVSERYATSNKEKEARGQRIKELEEQLTENQSDMDSKQVTRNRLFGMPFLFRI